MEPPPEWGAHGKSQQDCDPSDLMAHQIIQKLMTWNCSRNLDDLPSPPQTTSPEALFAVPWIVCVKNLVDPTPGD